MNTPEPLSAMDDGPFVAGHWPESVANEWCRMHVLIDELAAVQRRLGTPLEEAEDAFLVRRLGGEIKEKLEQLRPWLEESIRS